MKVTPIGFVVTTVLVCATAVNAQEPSMEPKAVHTLCAAANAILSTQSRPGILGDVIKQEATRHAAEARRLGATDEDLRQFVVAMGRTYNQGEISWEEISDLGQNCASFGI